MSNFSKAQNTVRPAARVIQLVPNCFADDWDRKPSEPIAMGLRLVSEGDIERVRAAASRRALEMIPEPGQDRVDNFNDAIMRGIVARSSCMPTDAREPFFPMPEDDVQNALTDDAVRFICQEYDLLKVEACNFLPEATDVQLAELAGLLLDEDAWASQSPATAKRLKRIALHLLEELDPEIRD